MYATALFEMQQRLTLFDQYWNRLKEKGGICLICGSITSTRYLFNEHVCNGCYQKAGNAGRREELKAAFMGKNALKIFVFEKFFLDLTTVLQKRLIDKSGVQANPVV